MTFPPGCRLFIILYEGTRRGRATQSRGQTLRASRIVWTRAKPQTTEHDMKALHIFSNDGLTQERLVFSFLFMLFPPFSVKSWQSNQAQQLKKCIGPHCFNSLRSPRISLCWSAYLSICVKPGKKMQIVWGRIEHVLIWTQSGLPSPEGWLCSAAGSHGAVCFAKSMWKSEQNRKRNFSAYISGTKYSLLISSLISLFKLQLITRV